MFESQTKKSELINEIEQDNNAKLRKRFLKMLRWLRNKPIEFEMYQGANVYANMRSIDYDILNLHVYNLQTPIGTVPEALIRTNDIVCFHFEI